MNKFKSLLKTALPHLGVILFFFILVFIYFFPAFDGQVLPQGDAIKYDGMARELVEHGEPSGWLGSMFSGMPSYQVTGYSEGINFMEKIKIGLANILHFKTSGPIFIMLICSYILFLVMGASIPLAIFGAIGITFPSYNFIIIEAGHVAKIWALAYLPLILAGFTAIVKKWYLPGFLLFVFGLYLQVAMNHFQITYYTAIFCFILFIAFVIYCIRTKDFKHLGISTGIMALAMLFVVGTNITNLYETSELAKESTRGKTELTPLESNESTSASKGLDKDYVFAWSYGKAETFTFLIPNFMGGVSRNFGEDSGTYKILVNKVQTGQIDGNTAGQFFSFAREYWGSKPFTSGPVYFGAIVCLLFLFAFFIVPGKQKWWLLIAAIFFTMLAWGNNLAWFNDFMYYYFPYYSRFRTVEMTLVIPGIIFPILSVMALKELFTGNVSKEKMNKALIYSVSIVGGICLIFWIMPGVFLRFLTVEEIKSGLPMWFLDALADDRKALLQADALRSLIFVLLAALLLYVYIKAKDKKKIGVLVIIGLIVLCLFDLWQVNKRYLNHDHFVSPKKLKEQTFKKSVADEAILADTALSFRVLNLNNPFNETFTSYFHKSIGGYHAAKLQRYQDLIDRRLNGEIRSIINTLSNNPTEESILQTLEKTTSLNMLNTKYIIYNPSQLPLYNPFHYGNAWFVDTYRFVSNADEEIEALNTLMPLTEAVLDIRFESNLKDLQIAPDSTAKIEMTHYAPDKLEYQSSSQKEGLVVFSEIYYPYGWKAYIDGQQVPISRVNWTLRALVVPAGEHKIEMVFDNDAIKVVGIITTVFSAILVLLLLGSIIYLLRRHYRNS
ncbi:MAG: YfhO family protein [Dysgonamonadaceae bacterium]|nr:YfhO family protein [Dysgonamonadaceae bacterium]